MACCCAAICSSGDTGPDFFAASNPRNCRSWSLASFARTNCNTNSRARPSRAACDCSSFSIRWSSAKLAAVSMASSRLVAAKALSSPLLLMRGLSSATTSAAMRVSREKETRTKRCAGSFSSCETSTLGTCAVLIPFVLVTWRIPLNSRIVKPRAKRCLLKRSRVSSRLCFLCVAMFK